MRMMKKVSATALIVFLVTALVAFGSLPPPSLPIVSITFAAGEINTSAEYSNGTIGSPIHGLALWYAWINTNDTQIVFLAYQSHMDNPPVVTFFGQHYYTEDNTEVFVGNTLTSMEVYSDDNGNGVPDTETNEIKYYFLVNSSSVNFVTTPIGKTMLDGTPHYTWGIRYDTIDGFLLFEDQFPAAKVMLDYMDFSYDFSIQNNVSYLKTNFGIGKLLETTPFSQANVTLERLSLSLLYGTTIISSKPYTTLVNGELYNSATTQTMVNSTDLGEIRIEDVKTYEFIFGQNYTLFRDSKQEIYESKSAAVANRSVSAGVRMSVEWLLSNLGDVLSGLFPRISSMQVAINLDYDVSSLLYKVCYPKWDGCRLEHDPIYVAYFGIVTTGPEIKPPILFVVAAAILGFAALTVALVDLKKTRKTLRYSIRNPPLASR